MKNSSVKKIETAETIVVCGLLATLGILGSLWIFQAIHGMLLAGAMSYKSIVPFI